MSTPKRIQRKRTKGWRMPEGAVYVGRPSERNNTGMLVALGAKGKHIYEGTVAHATVLKRRAKNKAARKARRAAG